MGRELTSLVWHAVGDRIDLIYDDGQTGQMTGSQEVALAVAHSAGLRVVDSGDGTIRWAKTGK